MQIEVKGRNTPVTDELREHVEKRFTKVGKQVSEFARLEIEVYEERNPAIADNQVAEATSGSEGCDPARAGPRARPAPRDQPLRGGALAPGQAPSREASRAPQGRDRDDPDARRSPRASARERPSRRSRRSAG